MTRYRHKVIAAPRYLETEGISEPSDLRQATTACWRTDRPPIWTLGDTSIHLAPTIMTNDYDHLLQLALEREDYAAAAEWANRALQVDVMDEQLHAWLAEAEVGRQRWPQAIREYEVAVELAPNSLAWRFALADAHVQAGQEDKAKTVLEQLLEIDPDFPGADVLLESLQP